MPHKQRFVSRPLFLQVRDELAVRIATGAWKAGTLLPNEIALAAEFGLSPGTVRKALDLLEAEKIVVRQQGRGTFVIDHDTEEMAIRFSSIYNDIGQKVSGHITSCEAVKSMPDAVEQEALQIEPDELVLRISRIREYHDHPFMCERSTIVVRHFPGITEQSVRDGRLSSLAQRHGVQISHATERVTPVMAPDEVMAKLRLPASVPILLLHRTAFRKDGTPLEFRTAWCHLKNKHYMVVTS